MEKHTSSDHKKETIASCVVCNAPSNISISQFMFSVDLWWQQIPGAQSYNIEIGLKGFTPGTGAATVSDNTNISLYFGVTGLESATTYDVYVQTICDNGEMSGFAGPFPFTIPPDCGDHFYDPGGPDEDFTETGFTVYELCPGASGQFAQVVFHELDIDPCCAFFNYQAGGGLNMPILLDGNLPGPITSNSEDGCLLLSLNVFSNASTGTGWDATFNCLTCPPINDVFIREITRSDIGFGWTGFDIIAGVEWEVGPKGFLPGTGSSIDGASVDIFDQAEDADGLMPGTEYELYTRLLCTQDSSPFAAPIPFWTAPTCGGHFYDPAGPGKDYVNGKTISTLICPEQPGDAIEVSFLEFETEPSNDRLFVFNGNSTSSPELGTFSGNELPGQLRSTHLSGCLAFRFITTGDNIPLPGWDAVVTCHSCPTISGFFSVGSTNVAGIAWDPTLNATSYNWEIGQPGFVPGTGAYLFNGNTGDSTAFIFVEGLESSTVYELYVRTECENNGQSYFSQPFKFSTNASCGDIFFDGGGPNAAYGPNENITTTICPTNPDQQITVVFNLFNTESCCDVLNVYHGDEVFGSPFKVLSGSILPDPIEAQNPGDCLTFQFISNGNGPGNGWEANVLCDPPLPSGTGKGIFQSGFKIFPNPTSSSLSVVIDYPAQEDVTLEVLDITGRLVLEKTWEVDLGNNQIDLEIGGLAAGTYMVILRGGYGIGVRRVVKY